MSAIDGFNSTWSDARKTYGEGAPVTGERFDASSKLDGLKSQMDAAAPGGRWSGGASEAYSKANADHQEVIGKIGAADRKLATQVTNAANLVTSGRTDLERLHTFINDAAANLPNNQAGKTMEMQLASKGLGQLTDIIRNTDDGMQTVKGNIDKIKGEYEALGTGQKFAQDGKGDEDPRGIIGDGEDDEKTPEEQKAEDEKQLAADRVREALEGDAQAAAQVDSIIDGISDEKLSGKEPLSIAEQQTLSQIGYQTKNMSLDQLTDVKNKLGDKSGILTNSWQTLSDPDVKVPETSDFSELHPELENPPVSGNLDRLPDSLVGPLKESAASYELDSPTDATQRREFHNTEQLQTIADLVGSGDERFQNGTQLDRALMDRGAELVDASNGIPGSGINQTTEQDGLIQDIFTSAGRDEIVNHDLITGNSGQEFLEDIAVHEWTDDGQAAKGLTDWIDDAANGDDPVMDRLAGETAHSVASFVGENHDELKNIDGLFGNSVGDRNPNLVQGWAEALAPYQEAMIGDGDAPGFGLLDGQKDGDYQQARNVFAIMNTDPTASENFSKHAYASILEYQQETSDAAAANKPADGTAMGNAGRMLGVMNEAANMAETDTGWDIRKAAMTAAFGEVGGHLPIVGKLGEEYLTNVILGSAPFTDDTSIGTHSFTEIDNSQKWTVASEIFDRETAPPPTDKLAQFIDANGNLKTPEFILQNEPTKIENYYQTLTDYANTANGWGTTLGAFKDEYDAGAGTRR